MGQILPPFSPVLIFVFFFAVIACVYTLAILVSDENLQKKRRRKQLLNVVASVV